MVEVLALVSLGAQPTASWLAAQQPTGASLAEIVGLERGLVVTANSCTSQHKTLSNVTDRDI